MRFLLLLSTTVISGLATTIISGYFLLIEWATLTQAHQNFKRVSQQYHPQIEAISIAEAAENRHRINCFAEGVGVLLGGIWFSIGIHGLCTMPRK